MLPYLRALSLVILLTTFASGCRKRHVVAPVAPVPAPVAPAESAPATPATPASPAPPAAAAQPQNPPLPEDVNQKNKPPQPQAPQPQPLPAQAPPAQSPQNPPPRRPNGAGQPTQAPRLGDILTPQQERQYNTAIDQSLARAQSSLGSVANRQLTKEQQGVVAQIQGFIQQAQSTRKSNLPAARSLAERAEVLARDLAGSLR
jgi:hypothetical protein